ncbi:MAG: RidA family protein [Thermodesulfobacteriota bacterium]|nr:RidA family protein [Thermodesulfobacteriota bacterium]
MDYISTDAAPAAVGPYSQAVKTGNLLFCSGQIGLVPGTKMLAGTDTASQARQALENMGAVLKAAGLGPDQVVKTTVFLVGMADFALVNDIYAGFFGRHKPARSTVQVAALPLGARVEIECMAVFS